MLNSSKSLMLTALMVAFPVFAKKKKHAVHVHGEAEYQVIGSGTTVELKADIPAMDILGTEKRAKTAAKKKQFKDKLAKLEKMPLLVFDPGCTLKKSHADRVEEDHDDHDDHGHKDHDDHGHKGHGHDNEPEHSSVKVAQTYTCKSDTFKSVKVNYSGLVKGLSLIRVEYVLGKKRGKKTTTIGNPKVL